VCAPAVVATMPKAEPVKAMATTFRKFNLAMSVY